MYQSSTAVNARLARTQNTRCTHVTKKIAIVISSPKSEKKLLLTCVKQGVHTNNRHTMAAVRYLHCRCPCPSPARSDMSNPRAASLATQCPLQFFYFKWGEANELLFCTLAKQCNPPPPTQQSIGCLSCQPCPSPARADASNPRVSSLATRRPLESVQFDRCGA
jgi:hypothetical protein